MHGERMVTPHDGMGSAVSDGPLPNDGTEMYGDVTMAHIHPRKRYLSSWQKLKSDSQDAEEDSS